MALIEKNNRFVFIHIFKCAGNSVRKVLTEQFNTYEWEGVHVEAKDVKKHFEAKGKITAYNRAFKFTFIRNPYDWMVSTYQYIKNSKAHPYSAKANELPFDRWMAFYRDTLMNLPRQHGQNKYLTLNQFITDEQGNKIVDMVGKYETIGADWDVICRSVGIESIALPVVNVTAHKTKDYKPYYNQEAKEIVSKVFEEDLDLFKYTY